MTNVTAVGPRLGLLDQLARDCHATNQHWWHHPATGTRLDRNKNELLMLMVSEVAEAMEGERKNLPDDKLPHRRMAEVELADVLIRIFDYAGGFGVSLVYGSLSDCTTLNEMAVRTLQVVPADAHIPNKAEGLFRIVKMLAQGDVRAATWLTLVYAGACRYDLDGAVAEKRAYNATRADHKAEARLAAHGKQF